MSVVDFSLYKKGPIEFIGKKKGIVLDVGNKETFTISNASRNNLSFLRIMVAMRQPDYETIVPILESKVEDAINSDDYYLEHRDEDIQLEKFISDEQILYGGEQLDLVKRFEYQLLSGAHILKIKKSITREEELDALAEAYLNLQDIHHIEGLGVDSFDAARFEVLTLNSSLNDRAFKCMRKRMNKVD